MTQNNRRVAEILLRYTAQIDQALAGNARIVQSLDQTAKATRGVEDVATKLDREFAELGRSKSLDGLSAEFVSMRAQGISTDDALIRLQTRLKQIGASDAEIRRVVQSIDAMGNAADSAGRKAAGAGAATGRSLGQNVTAAGRNLFNLPDVGGSTTASRLLILGGAAIDKFGVSTEKLVSTLAIGTPLAIAAAVGIQAVSRALAENEDRHRRYAEALLKVADATENSSRRQIEAQINALENENTVRRAQIALIEEQTGRSAANLQSLGQTDLADFTSFFGLIANASATIEGIGGSASQVVEANKALDTNTFLIAALTEVINNGSTAANDLKEAEQQLAQQREEYASFYAGIVKIQTDEDLRQLNLRVAIDKLTAEQREEKLAQDQRELDLINQRLQQNTRYNDLTIEAEVELRERQGELVEAILFTSEVTDTYADQQDRLTTTLQEQLSVLEQSVAFQTQLAEAIRTATVDQVADRLSAIEEERNAIQSILPELERLAPTSQEAADALEAARGRLTGLSADYFAFITRVLPAALKRAADAFAEEELKLREDSAAKIGDIEDKRREKEIEAGDKRDEAYISAREKRDEAEAKLAEDLAKRRRDIERRASDSMEDAKARRDVQAFELAKKQRDGDLKDLEEDGEDRRKEIDAQFLKERQIADENYRKALQQARKAADDSIRQEQDRLRREIQERAAAYQAQINQLQQFNIQGTQAIDSFVRNAVTGLQGLANSVIGIIGGGSGGGGGSKFPPLILPPGGQPGDDPGRYSSMRAFSAPTTERAFSQASGASGGSRGDVNISFTVKGVSEEKVMERVRVAYRKATQQLNAGM